MTKYKRAKIFSLSSLFLLLVGSAYHYLYISPKHIANFISSNQKEKELASTKNPFTATQKRNCVRKDIWVAEGNQKRLHYRIDSTASILVLAPQKDKMDIIENLEHIKCWMQDKFFEKEGQTYQQIRFFEAEKGTYQYTTQQFLAKTVALSLFRLPGSMLPLQLDLRDAFLKGIAEDVSFSVSESATEFHADHFKATLHPQTQTDSTGLKHKEKKI